MKIIDKFSTLDKQLPMLAAVGVNVFKNITRLWATRRPCDQLQTKYFLKTEMLREAQNLEPYVYVCP